MTKTWNIEVNAELMEMMLSEQGEKVMVAFTKSDFLDFKGAIEKIMDAEQLKKLQEVAPMFVGLDFSKVVR